MAKAGRILLLVGAIMGAIGAFFLILAGILLVVVGRNLVGDGDAAFPGTVVGAIYLVMGVVIAVGTVFGFLAYARAQRGDWHGAWVFGLVAALVPPLQVLPLLGAIFCLVSPEGEAAKRARSGPAQPL